ARLGVRGEGPGHTEPVAIPVAEIHVDAEGSTTSSWERLMGGAVGRRLRVVDHRTWTEGGRAHLEVRARDAVSGVLVVVTWSAWADLPVVRCRTEVDRK